MSLKFPEVSVPLRTLVFDGRQGAYPTSVEQNCVGLYTPAASAPFFALATLLLAAASPWDLPLGNNASSHDTLLWRCVPSAGSQSLWSFNLRPRAHFFPFWAGMLLYAFAFPRGRRSNRAPGSTWAPFEDDPHNKFPYSWGVGGTLAYRSQTLASRPRRSGKLLGLMRPWCFRFAFTPSSQQLERSRKNKVGVKSAVSDKVTGTPGFSRKRGGSEDG